MLRKFLLKKMCCSSEKIFNSFPMDAMKLPSLIKAETGYVRSDSTNSSAKHTNIRQTLLAAA